MNPNMEVRVTGYEAGCMRRRGHEELRREQGKMLQPAELNKARTATMIDIRIID